MLGKGGLEAIPFLIAFFWVLFFTLLMSTFQRLDIALGDEGMKVGNENTKESRATFRGIAPCFVSWPVFQMPGSCRIICIKQTPSHCTALEQLKYPLHLRAHPAKGKILLTNKQWNFLGDTRALCLSLISRDGDPASALGSSSSEVL